MSISVFAVLAINVGINLRYCWLVYTKKIKPALAMWLFFVVAVAISLSTYLANGNFSPMDNILNTSDLVMVSVVMLYVLFHGDASSRFTRFDKGCLAAVLAIVVFWAVTRNHFITNLAVQTIMVIAYFPVVKRMLSERKNTEPFTVWFAMFAVAGISLFSNKGTLANIYAIRAMACTGLLLTLMLRIEYLNRKQALIPSQQTVLDGKKRR